MEKQRKYRMHGKFCIQNKSSYSRKMFYITYV